MALTLSVLICTTSARSEVIKPLIKTLHSQTAGKSVEILINAHETDNVGKKRNQLLKDSQGLYVVFIDSDDEISDNYIDLILSACKSSPDCIGIKGTITTNGENEKKWVISKSYLRWFTGRDGNYYRTPNHISPVKRLLAIKAGFPEISHGEDAVYSKRLLPMLKTEVNINEPIYHYKFRNDEFK